MTYRVTEFRFRAELSGGDTVDVEADQRDWAAMETQDYPPNAHVARSRYLTWHAMKRQGLTKTSWEKFNLDQLVYVTDVTPDDDDEDGEGEQSLDPGPGQKAPGAARTSRSRGARVSRSPKS